MKNIAKIPELLLNYLKEAGADQAEVYLSQEQRLEIVVREQKIEGSRNMQPCGVGVRVLKNGGSTAGNYRVAFLDSSDLSESSLKEIAKRAVSLASLADVDAYAGFPTNNPKNLPSSEKLGILDKNFGKESTKTKIKLVLELEKLIKSKHPLIQKYNGAGYSESYTHIIIANTYGLQTSWNETSYRLWSSALAQKDNEKIEGEVECESRTYTGLQSIQELAEEAVYKAVTVVGGKPVSTGKFPVIFHRDAARVLFWGLFPALNGLQVAKGESYLAATEKGGSKIGQMIASEKFTLIDDGLITGGVKSSPTDHEGVPSSRKILIDKGVLKAFVYDTRAAKRGGSTAGISGGESSSTGNAFREEYSSLPEIRPSNLFIEKGSQSPEEIIAEVEQGLYVIGTLGFGIDAVSGNFSQGANGVWIEGGKLTTKPVNGVTIGSTLQEMLPLIDAVGNDLRFYSRASSPTLRVSEMTISGV